VKIIEDDGTLTDIEKLDRIIEMIENVLTEVVQARELLFNYRLRSDVKSSWDEVSSRMEQIPGLLREHHSDLEAAGLTGSNLNLKYEGLFESYRRLNRNGGTRGLRRCLRWAKIVIGSVATIVPGLKELTEILNEYMEAIDMGIEDSENAA
jgi:hypothetical protein